MAYGRRSAIVAMVIFYALCDGGSMMFAYLRNDYVLILAIVLLAVAVAFAPGLLPALAGGDKPYPLCDPIGMGGGLIIYRCIDEDEGNIIYMNDRGFVFVVEW